MSKKTQIALWYATQITNETWCDREKKKLIVLAKNAATNEKQTQVFLVSFCQDKKVFVMITMYKFQWVKCFTCFFLYQRIFFWRLKSLIEKEKKRLQINKRCASFVIIQDIRQTRRKKFRKRKINFTKNWIENLLHQETGFDAKTTVLAIFNPFY